MKKLSILLIFLLISGLILGSLLWQEIYLPKDSAFLQTENKLFSIEKGQNLFQIGEKLEKEGLIKSRFLFNFYVVITGKAKQLQAGKYLLNSSTMNIPEIAKKIISGDTAKMTVTIPEGFTVKQIEGKLNLKLVGENLEGFLFPDTYQFPLNVSGEEAVKTMRDNFEKKLAPYRNEISGAGLTLFEIVTMAAMIEKEVRTKEEKGLVSGILWKRLETGMPLQVDATIAYILNGEGWTFNEMRREIAAARDVDSPYNTYKYPGLPAGPICNPGLESILAAVYPESSEYWYYLSTPEGETIFSKTLEEHNIARAKYLK